VVGLFLDLGIIGGILLTTMLLAASSATAPSRSSRPIPPQFGVPTSFPPPDPNNPYASPSTQDGQPPPQPNLPDQYPPDPYLPEQRPPEQRPPDQGPSGWV